MDLIYKEIEKKDKVQLYSLINIVLEGIEDKLQFIPYEKWELECIFDKKNYALLHGAYNGNKLVGMSQLYVCQDMLANLKNEFEISNFKVCELANDLVLPEYRNNGIATNLQLLQLDFAKKMKFDYCIATVHPDNIASLKTLEKIGMKFIKETVLLNNYLRKLYILKLN